MGYQFLHYTPVRGMEIETMVFRSLCCVPGQVPILRQKLPTNLRVNFLANEISKSWTPEFVTKITTDSMVAVTLSCNFLEGYQWNSKEGDFR